MFKKEIFSVILCKEAIFLFAICAADLISTSIILSSGGGEANPFMRFILENGGIALITVIKLLWLFLTILLMELIRVGKIRFGKKLVFPKKIRRYYLVCIAIYILVYGIGFATVNF